MYAIIFAEKMWVAFAFAKPTHSFLAKSLDKYSEAKSRPNFFVKAKSRPNFFVKANTCL